jgi:hypothetical protein
LRRSPDPLTNARVGHAESLMGLPSKILVWHEPTVNNFPISSRFSLSYRYNITMLPSPVSAASGTVPPPHRHYLLWLNSSSPCCPLPRASSSAASLFQGCSSDAPILITEPSGLETSLALAPSSALGYVLCLRCAKYVARNPSASCVFRHARCTKCTHCRESKVKCLLVSSFFIFFLELSYSLFIRFPLPWLIGANKSSGSMSCFWGLGLNPREPASTTVSS